MTENQSADNPRLMSMASAISDGIPINWAQAAETDPETTSVMDELRMIETLARLSDPMPGQWGAFVIRGEIGHGSYGTVYRAHDRQLDIEVALKVIRPHALDLGIDPSHALREARLLAQINHPHVVRVYSAECLDQEVGIAMELVKGRTLHDLVRAQGPFSARETMVIGADVCGALAAVHGAGVLHGDIKANNVMRAEGGRTVLMDFGAGDDLKTVGRPRPRGRRNAALPRTRGVCRCAAHGGLGHLQPGRAAVLPGHRVVSGRRLLAHRNREASRRSRAALAAPRPPPRSARRLHPCCRSRHRGAAGRPVPHPPANWKQPCTKRSTARATIPLPPLLNWRGLAAAASVVLVLGLASWLWTSRSTAPPSGATDSGCWRSAGGAGERQQRRQLPDRSGVLS